MPEYLRARDGNVYFFTVVTYQRQPLLCLDESRATLEDIMTDVRESHPFKVKAWVLLPDHLHCIWELPESGSDYSLRWGLIKKGFTQRMKARLNIVRPSASRIRHRESTIWQRRFWEHQIRDEEDFTIHCNYIHYNPVKHGLVASPKDWEHSSFHKFVQAGLYDEHWGGTLPHFPEKMGGE